MYLVSVDRDAETLKVAGLARTLLIIYYETLHYVVFTYYKPGKITQKFISWQQINKYNDCWSFILAKNTNGWILGFCIAGLAENKKFGAWPPRTFCIKVCGY